MYVRLVRARANPEAASSLRDSYTNTVIPALQATPGCLSACLMQGSKDPLDVVSLTLWESIADAEAYVERGTFGELMKKVRPFLQDTTEWRMGLSRELKLEYAPVPGEPTISAYPVSLDLPAKQRVGPESGNLYLRIVSVMIKPDRKDEYHRLFLNEIIPTLQAAPGCLHAYLIMPSQKSNESLSMTIWDSKESADAYEREGLFSELVKKVKHTFTDLVQWKIELDPESKRQAASTEDLTVEGFSVIAMKSFQ